MRRTLLLHLAANAVLMALAYYWLGIGESHTLTLVWSLFLAAFMFGVACWVYGASFASFGEQPAWRTSFRHLPPFALAVLGFACVYWVIGQLADWSHQPAFQLASWLTLHFRKPVRPALVAGILNAIFWLVRWVLLPVPALPVLSGAANAGWNGLRAFSGKGRSLRLWVLTPILLFTAFRIPMLLLGWVPRVHGFGMETLSFTLRALLAYLLFGAAWLALAFVTSGGKPRFTQPKTVVSP